MAFVAFSLCASAVYLLNDLVDLNADRNHPAKRNRPFASGAIPVIHGMVAIPLLLVLAFLCALQASLLFAGVLLGYFFLSVMYSLSLKQKFFVDVVVLASLYTVRVIAGAAVIEAAPSEWLLGFSMFVFVALALVKRYAELMLRVERQLPDPADRNYRGTDLPVVGAMAAASGFNAITIFALYISSDAVKNTYRNPQLLWLICPLLLYWFGRTLFITHRGKMDVDPISFSLRDRISLSCGTLILAIVALAS